MSMLKGEPCQCGSELFREDREGKLVPRAALCQLHSRAEDSHINILQPITKKEQLATAHPPHPQKHAKTTKPIHKISLLEIIKLGRHASHATPGSQGSWVFHSHD